MEATTNDSKTNSVPNKKPGHFLFDTWFGTWFVYRIPAALIWYWLILKLFEKPFPLDLYIPKSFLFLPFLFFWLLLLFFKRKDRFWFYPLYVVFFYVAIIWILGKLILRVFKVIGYVFSTKSVFLLLSVIIVSWVLASKLSNNAMQAIAAIIAHISLYIIFLISFKLAANPYQPLLATLKFIISKGIGFVEKIYVKPVLEGKTKPSATSTNPREIGINTANLLLKLFTKITPNESIDEKGFSDFARSGFVPSFVTIFGLMYFILASSFSLTLFYIERAWGTQIEGISRFGKLIDYFYFSILSQATAIPNAINPVTSLGTIWIIWIVITGLLLLTILLTLFTTSVGLQSEIAIKSIKTSIEEQKKVLSDWIGNLQQIPNDQDETTKNEIIDLSNPQDSNN